MQICIFEDSDYINFEPLSLSRPVYELFCGINTLKEKIISEFSDSDVSLFCREYLTEIEKAENPNLPVNKLEGDSCLLINGGLLEPKKLVKQIPKKLKESTIFVNGEKIVAAFLTGKHFDQIKSNPQLVFDKNFFEGLSKENTDVKLINYIWDFIGLNGSFINNDVENLIGSGNKNISKPKADKFPGVHFIEKKNTIVGKNVSIKPGTVIDATEGPVFIDDEAEIFPNVVIEGPCYIGKSSKIKSCATIYKNVSIGNVCKVGGEVEDSVIMSYSNKQHSGFLGHSYLGSWINIGADTNNSDLKNNYSTVKITLREKLIDTSLQFLGLIMGDHSKTGINTMLNTGTVVGFSSNIFGSGFPPKFIPSFSWGGADSLNTYDLDKAIDTAKAVLKRRNKNFDTNDKKLFEHIFNLTGKERERRGI
jgi:UDP-N-acetylglucosamine diphosphorylase/glucosamine-1-phosphate N-acetyltransferase